MTNIVSKTLSLKDGLCFFFLISNCAQETVFLFIISFQSVKLQKLVSRNIHRVHRLTSAPDEPFKSQVTLKKRQSSLLCSHPISSNRYGTKNQTKKMHISITCVVYHISLHEVFSIKKIYSSNDYTRVSFVSVLRDATRNCFQKKTEIFEGLFFMNHFFYFHTLCNDYTINQRVKWG